jgi:hypothetical protein
LADEYFLEKMGIGLGGDAVTRAQNDDALGGRRAKGNKKRHQQQDGMFAQTELHEGIILTKTGDDNIIATSLIH